MGLLTDRFGAGRIMGAGVVMWALGSALTGLAPTFAALVAARLLLGVGEASSYPAGNRIVREWAPRSERGLMVAIFTAGAAAGPALGILLTSYLISVVDWRTAFLIVAGLTAAWAVVWMVFYRSPERAGWLATAPYLVTTLGLLVVGVVSDRMAAGRNLSGGARRLLMIGMMALASCVLFVPVAQNIVVMEVLVVASVLFASSANTLNYALAADLAYDQRSAGAVFGLLVLGGNSFGFLAPILTGFIIAQTQEYTLSFVLAAALLLCGIVVSWTTVRRPLQPA